MTKERKIAIKMWKYIRLRILFTPLARYIVNHTWLGDRKSDLAKRHGVSYWEYCCWFCQYVRYPDTEKYGQGCQRCPIAPANTDFMRENGCSVSGSLYSIIARPHSKLAKLKACSLIIKVLEGRYDARKS